MFNFSVLLALGLQIQSNAPLTVSTELITSEDEADYDFNSNNNEKVNNDICTFLLFEYN